MHSIFLYIWIAEFYQFVFLDSTGCLFKLTFFWRIDHWHFHLILDKLWLKSIFSNLIVSVFNLSVGIFFLIVCHRVMWFKYSFFGILGSLNNSLKVLKKVVRKYVIKFSYSNIFPFIPSYNLFVYCYIWSCHGWVIEVAVFYSMIFVCDFRMLNGALIGLCITSFGNIFINYGHFVSMFKLWNIFSSMYFQSLLTEGSKSLTYWQSKDM